MKRSAIFSTPQQLNLLADLLSKYIRLPFSANNIPGSVMEGALAHVRGGGALRTYDFVDVINTELGCGWQVKSTLAGTPVTWKRVKLPAVAALIATSHQSADGARALGDAIIEFCNQHAAASLQRYDLREIGYSRLIVHPTGSVTYYERLLCTRARPHVFKPGDFEWRWSTPKTTKKKEQLSALHGFHRPTASKWFAWHGLGENQLHFGGERHWWPKAGDLHAVTFPLPTPTDRIELEKFIELLARLDA